MPIVSVSRWSINRDDASRIVRDVAPLIKNHGATNVTLGRVHSGGQGQDVGQTADGRQETIVVVTYPNWETYGRAMEAQHKDQQYQAQFATAQKLGTLLQRTIVITEEIATQ